MLLVIPFIALGCSLLEGGIGSDIDASATVGSDATLADATMGDVSVAPDADDAGDASEPFDAPTIDAAAVCPARCAEAGIGTCGPNGTCEVACVAASTCLAPIVCPAGIPCSVTCTGAGSCTSTIDCTAASSCTINCVGGGTCTGRVGCSGSSCAVNCVGIGSCTAGVCCDAGTCDGSPTPPACP